ncbi:MAG: ModD protein [Sulfurimonas sp.]|uniref:ModD protein n=1 Tax=Sulfurimonas sp. TaxID=2022749 RepID=UPI002624DAE1|nr:ModD protein [Sulfurimonas sp.]MDD2652188.1 ModD protein [Sulfurimonas sp.]MDD3450529.1 ModD protein [Sulfurimonas sp.]
MDLLREDSGYFDLTTFGLGIGEKLGSISFAPKSDTILSGCDEAKKVFQECQLEYTFFQKNGTLVKAGQKIAECKGDAKSLHRAWKTAQNIFEYMSGIATYTHEMVQKAQLINPDITIATTRKNFPGTKELMLKAVMDGGGVAHRLGLFDSVLIFEQHLVFLQNEEELIKNFHKLKKSFIEKKIIVEVESYEQARYFAQLGADVLQCEKMSPAMLSECVGLKKEFGHLLVSATGGINASNIAEFVACGVDAIITSSPYHAKPADIKVIMEQK